MPLVPVYGSTGAQRTPCAAPAARAAPGTALFAAPASGEPPAAARAARAALRDYSRRARTQPRRQRRLASAGSPPRRVLPQRCRAGAPRLSGRPPASRQSAWGAPGAGGARAARGLHLLCLASAPNGRRSARLKRQLCWNEFSAREILEMPACRRHRPPRAPLACAQPPRSRRLA